MLKGWSRRQFADDLQLIGLLVVSMGFKSGKTTELGANRTIGDKDVFGSDNNFFTSVNVQVLAIDDNESIGVAKMRRAACTCCGWTLKIY